MRTEIWTRWRRWWDVGFGFDFVPTFACAWVLGRGSERSGEAVYACVDECFVEFHVADVE